MLISMNNVHGGKGKGEDKGKIRRGIVINQKMMQFIAEGRNRVRLKKSLHIYEMGMDMRS